jgi:hypothetical protein
MVLAGCAPPAATTTTEPVVTTTTTIPPAAAVEQFITCLTDAGVAVPGDLVGEDGRPDLGRLQETNDVSAPLFRAVLGRCAAVLAVNGVLATDASPELAAAVREHLAQFAACVREQGVEGFPDPAADFDGHGSPFPEADIPRGAPGFDAAIDVCVGRLNGAPPSGG